MNTVMLLQIFKIRVWFYNKFNYYNEIRINNNKIEFGSGLFIFYFKISLNLKIIT